MFSWNAKGFSLLQQLEHHLSAFHLSNLALPAAIASGVYTDRGLLHAVFRILCGKQTVTDRQNSIAIRPAQRQHAEAVGVDMLGVVKNLGEEFYLLRAGTAVYGVIYDEHIKPVFAGKRFDGLLDDS